MVNKKVTTLANSESNDDEDDMAEMCVAMDDLRRQNKILEDNVFHIQQCQQEDDPIEEIEILDPQPLSDEIQRGSWCKRT